MDQHLTAPDHVPHEWPPFVAATPKLCACPSPLPEARAERKGAARTHCARCGLPIRIEFRRS
jgi:hypothetical protein